MIYKVRFLRNKLTILRRKVGIVRYKLTVARKKDVNIKSGFFIFYSVAGTKEKTELRNANSEFKEKVIVKCRLFIKISLL